MPAPRQRRTEVHDQPSDCHDRDIPPHPSLVTPTRVYSQSRPHPNSPWPNPNPSQAFPSIYSIPEPICSIPEGMLRWHLLSKHSRSGERHSQTHLTIPDEPETSRIPSTNPELARSSLNPKTQYTQPWLGKARMPSYIPDWVLFLFFRTYYYPSLLTLVSFFLSLLSSINPVSV